MNKIIRYTSVIVTAAILSSCNIYKKYELPVDNAFVNDYKQSAEAAVDSTSLPFLRWEEVFTDPTLQGYIRQALAVNTDLDDARRNVEIAQAQLKGAKLSYFPAVALSPNGGSSKYGSGKMDTWTYSIPLSVNWEIDVFGKILNRKRGARVTLEQMEDYRQAVQSQIICGVANCYYGLVLLQEQLDLTKRTSDIWKDQVESMKLMKEAGWTNEAAVVQSTANYYNIMASIPDIEQSIHELNTSMSILLRSYPQEWAVDGDLDFNLPVELTSGVPLTYLAARPDVRAAERGLAKAYYSVNSARAAFYPGLTISAQGGFTNLLGSMVSNPGKFFIQLAGSLAAPLFSRGQNIANLEVAKAQQAQAMNAFEKTVISAAGDVSNALVSYTKNVEKREWLVKQVEQLEKSVEYTQELFTLDQKTTYLEVLTARSSLLQAQLASLACWHSKVTDLITLYQAVGGAAR
jgi:efflux transporter, outer membrane factor lipoprotein, NodT family